MVNGVGECLFDARSSNERTSGATAGNANLNIRTKSCLIGESGRLVADLASVIVLFGKNATGISTALSSNGT